MLGWYGAAHISFGQDLAGVESMISKAIAAAPGDVALRGLLGWAVLCRGGEPQRALDITRDAMERDPSSPSMSYNLLAEAACLLLLRQYRQAIPIAREVVMRRPQYLFAEAILASILAHDGQVEEARIICAGFKAKGMIERILPMFRNPEERALLRKGLMLAGLDD